MGKSLLAFAAMAAVGCSGLAVHQAIGGEPTSPAAVGTDGVIYHLWQHGQEFLDGTVSFPQSLGHKFPGYSNK